MSPEQVRQWILERRADASTRIRKDGETEWSLLGDRAEFIAALHSAQPEPVPAPATPNPRDPDIVDTLEPEEFATGEFGVIESYVSGWKLLLANAPILLTVCLLTWAIRTFLGWVPLVGGLASLIVTGALEGGLCYVFLRCIREASTGISDVFIGFRLAFFSLMMGYVLTSLLSSIGFIFCLLPGIYLFVAWVFTQALIIDKDLDFWTAMETSRRTVGSQWFGMFALLGIALLPTLAYLAFLYYQNMKIVMPFMPTDPASIAELMNVLGRMAEEIEGNPELQQRMRTLQLGLELTVLVNMPILFAAIMQAYEAIFRSPTPTRSDSDSEPQTQPQSPSQY